MRKRSTFLRVAAIEDRFGLCPSPVSSICPHSHHKSPATLAQSSDRVTHHLMSTSAREKTLKERIGHRLETQVTRSSWLLHSRDVGSARFACMPHRCAFGSAWRFLGIAARVPGEEHHGQVAGRAHALAEEAREHEARLEPPDFNNSLRRPTAALRVFG